MVGTGVPLSNLVVHAAVQAFAEAIGASGAAHGLALGLWVAPPERAFFSVPTALGSGVAVIVATRARLFPALVEAWRGLAHPRSLVTSAKARDALVIAWIAAVSAGVGTILARASGGAPEGERTIAIGLGLSGIALFAGALVSASRDRGDARSRGRATYEAPTWIAATLAGCAHAFGSWPGVSRVGAAASVLLALGVKPQRAMEIALVATVPFWWFEAARSAGSGASPRLGGGAIAVALFGFLGAYAAIALWRALAAKRALVAVSLWMIPLACAIFAYGRAHPSRSTSSHDDAHTLRSTSDPT